MVLSFPHAICLTIGAFRLLQYNDVSSFDPLSSFFFFFFDDMISQFKKIIFSSHVGKKLSERGGYDIESVMYWIGGGIDGFFFFFSLSPHFYFLFLYNRHDLQLKKKSFPLMLVRNCQRGGCDMEGSRWLLLSLWFFFFFFSADDDDPKIPRIQHAGSSMK